MNPSFAILCLAVFVSACGGDRNNGASEKSYAIRGEVVAIDSTIPALTISHGDIPGLMKGMTMSFEVKNRMSTISIMVGDSIAGKLVVSKQKMFLDSLVVVSKSPQ